MNSFLVYLAGPIDGLNYAGATEWRKSSKKRLLDMSGGRIESLSPMRWKDMLSSEERIEGSYEGTILSSARGLFFRDNFDCRRADALLVNLLGSKKPSLGTIMEIAWAYDHKIPMAVAVEDDGGQYKHPMIEEAIRPFRCNSLEVAEELIFKILMPA